MGLNAWNRFPGVRNGRVQPASHLFQGDNVFILGDYIAADPQRLEPGDYTEISQTGDLTGIQTVTFRGRLRGPASIPQGRSWRASLMIDGVEAVGRDIPDNRVIDVTTLTANTSKLVAGNHTITFRLAFV